MFKRAGYVAKSEKIHHHRSNKDYYNMEFILSPNLSLCAHFLYPWEEPSLIFDQTAMIAKLVINTGKNIKVAFTSHSSRVGGIFHLHLQFKP